MCLRSDVGGAVRGARSRSGGMLSSHTLRTVARGSLLALALSSSGCSYLRNRCADLLDIASVDVGYGPGVYAEARATDFLVPGLGVHSYLEAYSLHGRYAGEVERWSGFGLPPFLTATTYMPADGRLVSVVDGDRSGYDLHMEPPWASYAMCIPGVWIGSLDHAPGYSVGERGMRVADVGVHVQCLVGVRLGFSPGESVDWLLGWFGLDLSGDDARLREAAVRPAESASPAGGPSGS